MKKTYGITEINPRTAKNIAGTSMKKTAYNISILKAARHLVDAGLGHMAYGGQFASGNTWWRDGDKSVGVNFLTGEID